jgi:hypothetical protein
LFDPPFRGRQGERLDELLENVADDPAAFQAEVLRLATEEALEVGRRTYAERQQELGQQRLERDEQTMLAKEKEFVEQAKAREAAARRKAKREEDKGQRELERQVEHNEKAGRAARLKERNRRRLEQAEQQRAAAVAAAHERAQRQLVHRDSPSIPLRVPMLHGDSGNTNAEPEKLCVPQVARTVAKARAEAMRAATLEANREAGMHGGPKSRAGSRAVVSRAGSRVGSSMSNYLEQAGVFTKEALGGKETSVLPVLPVLPRVQPAPAPAPNTARDYTRPWPPLQPKSHTAREPKPPAQPRPLAGRAAKLAVATSAYGQKPRPKRQTVEPLSNHSKVCLVQCNCARHLFLAMAWPCNRLTGCCSRPCRCRPSS